MRRLAWLLLLLWLPVAAHAQTVTTGISRDSLRVGDPVRVLLRIEGIPATTEVVLPDSLALVDDMENAGRLRLRRDTLPGGGTRITAAYPIILWRPGALSLPQLPMILRSGGTERTHQVTLPTINVLSVLPADTTGIEAKPPKDVWGADRLWWPWLVAGLLLLIIAALLYWWYRRRRRAHGELPLEPVIDPRAHALAGLQRIRTLRLLEEKQYRELYIQMSDILRAFAARMEPEWSTDLTTEELAPRLRPRPDAHPLLGILRSADVVKFAKGEPTSEEALHDLNAAEAWVSEFNRPVEAPAAEAA